MDLKKLGELTFSLSKEFVKSYETITPPFGFNGLGELTYLRTYSRLKSDGTNEKWYETVERVVNGIYSMQKNYITSAGLGWNEEQGTRSAEEMYDRMFKMKFLPPGRGLWSMGSEITQKGVFSACFNCAFTSTENIDIEPTKPFEFLMDMSMLGVGVGFDVEGAGKVVINHPRYDVDTINIEIEDSREGWVNSVKSLLMSYFEKDQAAISFNYEKIRPLGAPIKTFGGVSSGSAPLEKLHNQIRALLDSREGELLTATDIVDIQNMIGCCVVSGNVRRSAEIVIGPDTEEYLKLKDYKWDGEKYIGSNSKRAEYGWASNNSVSAVVGQDYTICGDQTGLNGEPGYIWLDNMKKYGRMMDPINNKDHKAKGSNPCVEQTLESFELCCLVETFPYNCTDKEDFLRTLKFAYLFAKTVTLSSTHWEDTNRVMLRNRRIGTSQSGVAQIINKIGIDAYKDWCIDGYNEIQKYDEIYSDWFCIPKSIKTTSIKPSGTVSLLAGATPGMHFPESNYYIRRIRIAKTSKLIDPLKEAGYVVEDDVVDNNTYVVEVPVEIQGVRTQSKVSMWEQVELAAFIQRYWADNQVSCTVTFNPELTEEERERLYFYNKALKETPLDNSAEISTQELIDLRDLMIKDAKAEGKQIKHLLNYYQYHLKGISFLPRASKGSFAQMPYEEISAVQYNEMKGKLKEINFMTQSEDSKPEMYCTNDTCVIK